MRRPIDPADPAFVMGGSLSRFWFMLRVVAPFDRRPADTPGRSARPWYPKAVPFVIN
jgi:hypothetical protein